MIYRYEPRGVKSDLYLGITETTWAGAPIATKGEEVTSAGVTHTLVGSSQDVDHIWWVNPNPPFSLPNPVPPAQKGFSRPRGSLTTASSGRER
jgi:hypothetical protein